MATAARLSALVVNYESGAFAVRCLESLIEEWGAAGRRREDLEIILLENASPSDQSEYLGQMESLGAVIVRSDSNLGYGGGMNLALSHSRGRPDDIVAVLNPDLYFLPGSIAALMSYVEEHDDVGAVDPRACIDPLGVVNLPPNLMPGLRDRFLVSASHMSRTVCRYYSRGRKRKAQRYWQAEEPIESDMLSGCCLFMRRSVVARLGTLFDDRFPLYFEDTDLFRRLGGLGLKLVHHGGAKVLHHWSRSAGVGEEFQTEAMMRYVASQQAYFGKYYGTFGERWLGFCSWMEVKWPESVRNRSMHPLTELGEFREDPVEIVLPHSCRYLLELAVDSAWIVACGILGEGDRWRCPKDAWDWWFQADYFLRGFDLDTGEFLGAWHLKKGVLGRRTPLEPGELASYGTRVFGGRLPESTQ